MELPPHFTQTVSDTFPGGAAWLEELPARLAECVQNHDLTLVSPNPFPLSFNYVVPAVQNSDGREVVVKLSVPGNEEFATESAALRVWNGHGAVLLLECDTDSGVQILERLRPGTMLSDFWDAGRDDASTEIAARVMQSLWSAPAPIAPGAPPFRRVSDWARDLETAGLMNTPMALLPQIARARSVFAELFRDTAQQKPTLLHGDLHHFNLLQDGENWKAIDPKGVWGSPAYEAGAFLRNPWPGLLAHADPQNVTNRRLDIFADSWQMERETIRLWAFASAVLSAWWSVEDNEPDGGTGWRHSARVADLLDTAA